MEQLELFESGELMRISHYLTSWSEATRTKRLAEIKSPQRGRLGNAGGEPLYSGEET